MKTNVLSPLLALAAYPVHVLNGFKEYATTIRRYYPNPRFRRADLLCLWAYLTRDPHAICEHFLRDYPDDQVQKMYGESFFTTLEKIAEAVDLDDKDVVYDLGCGRGRSVFWFNTMFGCRAVGIEINPMFVINARLIQKALDIDNVEFILSNLMDADYSDATVIYLYGTALSDTAIVNLVERFVTLKPGTRVVTVSYSLSRYTELPMFALEKTIRGKFVWGETDIYIQRKL
ncbi:MAG TPA: class I SAM-dependent methyltransferase [Noviherbaspirillum sp.]|uniref:class I SAM-dependent methyltransferase n=1 Tax=Noviherbaspirillum sp. TaxID=1926288 RepID=UPI002B480261|nr:class I SAM-dependent methyltransferase [Noviherbaspirillum sp.]HJV84792.1 class I SAM-dependent methyltransferase [Noviherbaspirillum sp.]